MRKLTDEEKQKRVQHFRKVIKYRSWFGWVFTVVGGILFGVGLKNSEIPLVMINGVLFFGYGLFMVRQTKKARESLDRGEC
jgi:lipoprotein signal peptidase